MAHRSADTSPYAKIAAAIRRTARDLDDEPQHAFQVRHNALALIDALAFLTLYDDRDRFILESGALLHDIGYVKGPKGHHKTARDMILALDIPGWNDRDRRMTAAVARYHRKGHPKPDHKVYTDLTAEERARVDRNAALLRIADGLDRTHTASAHRIDASLDGDALLLTVHQRQPNDTDIWGALRKAALLEDVLQRAVRIVAA